MKQTRKTTHVFKQIDDLLHLTKRFGTLTLNNSDFFGRGLYFPAVSQCDIQGTLSTLACVIFNLIVKSLPSPNAQCPISMNVHKDTCASILITPYVRPFAAAALQ